MLCVTVKKKIIKLQEASGLLSSLGTNTPFSKTCFVCFRGTNKSMQDI